MTTPPTPERVSRRHVSHEESVRAVRSWWDGEAETYHAEHGTFLGDASLTWGPEGWTEEDLGLLGPVAGRDVLEVGAGAGQGARWCAAQGARAVATDLSAGMLRVARRIDAATTAPPGMATGRPVGYVQCDGARLPFPDASFDLVITAHGVLSFIPDIDVALEQWARVLRPGGRCVASLSHPFRWAFPDVPGPEGLTVGFSYFDRHAYVEETEGGEATYTEHHRTVGDLVRAVAASGLRLLDLVEPAWPEGGDHVWGGWSRLRGELIPGTLVLVCVKG
ncbi:class I SAM-dependent methyltransferase [Ornithinimicrobium cerasi]|uniref:Methyltransferase domain-containing protein n=1 Tax=Ornithinimicrobium cerasi TaxID=2248773 RepID=A0A285VMU3_9MICO|nr:class I SAM-dependent methyltransferase [Ornithinimicrobium cerasi]SOC54536.1 Methyltransferase domain-containing protein [Ornithinimicrobium cerasi]